MAVQAELIRPWEVGVPDESIVGPWPVAGGEGTLVEAGSVSEIGMTRRKFNHGILFGGLALAAERLGIKGKSPHIANQSVIEVSLTPYHVRRDGKREKIGLEAGVIFAGSTGIRKGAISRREFLRFGGLAAAGTALAACGGASPQTKEGAQTGQAELVWPDLTAPRESARSPEFIPDDKWGKLSPKEKLINLMHYKMPEKWQRIYKVELLTGNIASEVSTLVPLICDTLQCGTADTISIYTMDELPQKLKYGKYLNYTDSDWQQLKSEVKTGIRSSWVDTYKDAGKTKRKIILFWADAIEELRPDIDNKTTNEIVRNRAIAQLAKIVLNRYLHEIIHTAEKTIAVPSDKKETAKQMMSEIESSLDGKSIELEEVIELSGLLMTIKIKGKKDPVYTFNELNELRHDVIYLRLLEKITGDSTYAYYLMGPFSTERSLLMIKFLKTIGINDLDDWIKQTDELCFPELIAWLAAKCKISPQKMVVLFNALDTASEKLFTPGKTYEEEVAATKAEGEKQWEMIKTLILIFQFTK